MKKKKVNHVYIKRNIEEKTCNIKRVKREKMRGKRKINKGNCTKESDRCT